MKGVKGPEPPSTPPRLMFHTEKRIIPLMMSPPGDGDQARPKITLASSPLGLPRVDRYDRNLWHNTPYGINSSYLRGGIDARNRPRGAV
jgi:hypothetical protein